MRLRPRIGHLVFDHDVVAGRRRNERARQPAERVGFAFGGAAGRGPVVLGEVGQHHLFLFIGERLRKRRALRIELHGVQHLPPARLIAARADDPLQVMAGHAVCLDDFPGLAGWQLSRHRCGAALARLPSGPRRRQLRCARHRKRQIRGCGPTGRHLDRSRRRALVLAADRLHDIFARRKLVVRVLALLLGDDHEKEAAVGVLHLHERAFERLARRIGDDAGQDAGSILCRSCAGPKSGYDKP